MRPDDGHDARPHALLSRAAGVARVGFALASAWLVLASARDATAAPREHRFFSAHDGVGVEAPAGWSLSLHTGYPEILCVFLHPDGSRLSLSAATTKAPDARALAEQSRRGLEAQHLAIIKLGGGPRGGVLVEARGAAHATELRQLYLVRSTGATRLQGIVVTLSARAETLASAGPAFDWVVAHLVLEAPTAAEEPTAATPHGAARAPDAGSAAERAGAEGDR